MARSAKPGSKIAVMSDPFLISDDQLRGKTTIDRVLGSGDITRLIGG